VAFDTDVSRVERLVKGDSYVEDVSSGQLAKALATGRYLPTSDEGSCEGFEVGIVTVPTPLKEGTPDLSFIEEAGAMLGRHLRPNATVVLESTTYPGTTVEFLVPILEKESGLTAGEMFHVGYSPERIDPGNRTWGLTNTPKVISGIDERSLESVRDFYNTIVDSLVTVNRTQEAELVKLIENTFRHVNVALVNEVAMFAAELGVDIWEALAAADTKPFGFMRFNPGPGVGGHCLPVDPIYLSWQVKRRVGDPFRFVELANNVNDHMPHYVIRRLIASLNRRRQPVNGAKIFLLGLAYKPNTGDVRGSPAVVVAERLLELGADVSAADPHVERDRVDSRIRLVELTGEALASADQVVVLTDHDCFDWDLVERHSASTFDTRCRLGGPAVEHL
jgi:UDP-N-acetyl-D-glucosamine dehydrogenase